MGLNKWNEGYKIGREFANSSFHPVNGLSVEDGVKFNNLLWEYDSGFSEGFRVGCGDVWDKSHPGHKTITHTKNGYVFTF